MIAHERWPIRIASAALLSIALAGCSSAPTSTSSPPDLQVRIEAAQTRGDHESLAAFYDKEATTARATATEHRKMARAYIGGRGGSSMAAHCDAIARSHGAIAAEYEGLAAGHRQMAGQAKP